MRKDPVMYMRLPAELLAWIKEQAHANRRSMTGEVALLIDNARRAQMQAQQQGAAQ